MALTPAQRALAAAIVRAIVREEAERANRKTEISGERERLRLIERVEPRAIDVEEVDV
jgi:hypothetical protein